ETENPLEVEEETPSKHIEKNEIESSNEADVAEDVPLDMTEMDAKTNDINDGFRRFFSNIGLRLSIKRGSTDLLRDLPDETNQDEPSGQENLEDSAEEIQIEDAEQNTEVNIAQDVLENAEEKATEAKEDVESDNADSTTSPAVEDTQQDTTPEEEPNSLSPPEQADVVSPIKRFFTTGIFSGLRKKRKAVEDDVNEKEMVDMGKKEAVELAEETEYDQQEDKEQIDPGVEAAVADTEVKENELKQEILSVISAEKVDEEKSPTTDHSTAIDTTTIFPESETQNSQEKDKVQASPLKRLLSGSSFKKLSKKPRSRRSSDAKLSDSGEHAADQLLSSTESTENQKEEKSTQPSPEATVQEDGAWVSFKKLLTPKKHTRTPSLSNKETEIPDSGEEPKPSDGEQISDHSTEEGKKRKDSSVSWEAVLCGSGKKRSRKTSDSEDESPQIDDNKQDVGSKNGAELPEESANEKKNDVSVSSPKQSPLIGDGGSTWKSFKRLVTPKRKAKDEDESKDIIQSDSEVSQDESSFSIKKLLPGRKKRKSAEKQDHISSDEADKDVPSDDEDSETPAVVPMSEFDTPESVIQIQTQVDIESHFPKEVPQDVVQQMPKPILSCDSLQNEAKELKENGDAVDNGTSTIPAKIEQLDNVSEIISKHQQLSDITEEGMITETMATPISINEEVGRDDTLAEDLLEITSEAITAPEPASVTTLADETEMISAVSQLSSESSKTSGNTTPVPAEYEVKETEELLHQVVENISTSPMAVPISSTTPKSESIVGTLFGLLMRSLLPHKKVSSDDVAQKLTITDEPQPKTEVGDEPEQKLPDEVVTAEHVQEPEGLPSEEENSLKETKTEEGLLMDKHEVTESIAEDSATLPIRDDKIEPVDASETQKEPQELQMLQPAILDPKTGGLLSLEQKISEDFSAVETVTEKPRQETEVRVGSEEKLLVKAAKTDDVQESQVLPSDVEDTIRDTSTDGGESMDVSVVTEIIEECATIPLNEESIEPANPSTTVLPFDGENTVKETSIEGGTSIHVPEVTESTEGGDEKILLTKKSDKPMDLSTTEQVKAQVEAQTSPLDSEVGNLLPFEKVISEDIPAVETVTEEPKKETGMWVEAVTTEYVQLPEPLISDVKEPVAETSIEEGASIHVPVVTERTEVGHTTVTLTKGSPESVDASKTEHVEEPEDLSLHLKVDSLLLPEKVISELIPAIETITEQPQEAAEVSDETADKQTVGITKTEPVVEIEVLSSNAEDSVKDTKTEEGASTNMQVVTESTEEGSATTTQTEGSLEHVDPSKTDHVEEAEESQTVQESLLSQLMNRLLPQKKLLSDDLSQIETVTDETQPETEVKDQPEENLPVEAEHIPELEDLSTVQEAQFDSRASSLFLEKIKLEDITAV
uniref:A kinase-anchoring proteins AKAP-5 and AKAP-12 calmodulin (CaM)-binding domain-containing protein n=1 Tax=Labrus bergylta TaxID=56723 RepID=A0A3Q3EHF6_9LABR